MEETAELRKSNNFICPHCGTKHSIDEAHLKSFLIKEKSEMLTPYLERTTKDYTNIRVCHSCRNKLTYQRFLRYITYMLVAPLIIVLTISLCYWEWLLSWKTYLIYMGISLFPLFPIISFYREIIWPKHTKQFLQKALKGNAIVRPQY